MVLQCHFLKLFDLARQTFTLLNDHFTYASPIYLPYTADGFQPTRGAGMRFEPLHRER
jgi:hypothetical protein